jgi:carboxypeptidase C (cathepsin A)
MSAARLTALLLLSLWSISPLQSAEPPPAPPEKVALSVTTHSITVGGKTLQYKATAGYLVQKEEVEKPAAEEKGGKGDGQPPSNLKAKAKIFFVAYTLEGADASANRPLTFAFNGGPGAASVWLHLGALGPQRVKLGPGGAGTAPPYQLVDNEFTWLEQSDLVFIDPVSTGYSRPEPGQNAKAFHGVREDLDSVAEFIRLYTTQNDRWLSPKFIVGESYGGTRAAALAGVLQENFSIYCNGIVIVSGVLNWQGIEFQPGNDLAYAAALPTYAATAWFHQRLAPAQQQAGLKKVREEAEAFAGGEYAAALAKGSALLESERRAVTERLAGLTGLSAEFLSQHDLRVSAGTFREELLRDQRQVIGRFDSELAGPTEGAGGHWDPSFTTMRGNFTAAMNAYARRVLKFESELPYQTLADVSPWNFSVATNRYLQVGDDLAEAMTQNPHLKVWVLTGCYDLAVPYAATGYELLHLGLDPSIAPNLRTTVFESGHMMYTHEEELPKLKAGFAEFVKDALK